jgi:hypothetical protein
LIWNDRVDSGGNDNASAVAVDHRHVFVVGRLRPGGSDDLAIRSYDRRTGNLLWDDTFDNAGGNDSANAVASNGRYVFAGGSVQRVPYRDSGFVIRAYEAEAGDLEWMDLQIEPQASSIKAIAAHGEQVYAAGVGFYLDLLVRAYKDMPSISERVINIDIKPWSQPDKSNKVRLPPPLQRVKVQILSTNTASGESVDFDALQVDPTTVRFGPWGASPIPRYAQVVDKDHDGDKDLFMKFNTYWTGISCTDTEATMTGKTYAGEPFIGKDSVSPYPCP